MGVTTTDDNRTPNLLQVLSELQSKRVEVGIFGDDDSHLLMVARVHEFGCQIEVTDAMRGWFRVQGYPLKKETSHINIPERSFMRTGFDENEKELSLIIEALIPQVILLRLRVDDFYGRIGTWMVSKLQNKLRALKDPPNHPMTVEKKGSSNPLIDTGRLIESITYKVTGG